MDDILEICPVGFRWTNEKAWASGQEQKNHRGIQLQICSLQMQTGIQTAITIFPEMTRCCLLSTPDSPIQEKSSCLLFKVKHWFSLQPGCSLLTEPCRQLHICTFIPASFNCVSLKITSLLNTFSEQSLALYISSWTVLKIPVVSHRLIFLTLLKFYWTNPTSRFMWFSKYQGQF